MPTDLPTPAAETTPVPETLFLAPSRLRWLITLVVSLAILALDILFLTQGGSLAVWFLIFLFSCVALLSVSQLLPGGGGLWLDAEGFSMKVAFYTRRRRWSEITRVEFSSAGLIQLVGYHIVGEPKSKPREVLPETYGIGAGELARVLNFWRDRALGHEPAAAPVLSGLDPAGLRDGSV